MQWILAGYMWLFIHRPFEVWPWLAEFRIERVYMLMTLGVWLLSASKGWTANRVNVAVAALFAVVVISWLISPVQHQGTKVVEDYAKIGVFYVLLMSCVRDKRTLRFIIAAFLVCTALYMAHSLREYMNGRHSYKMGTVRMIGADIALGDPNSFAASLVYSLPLTIPFWMTSRTRWEIAALAGYVCLASICILLTGSRTGLAGLAFAGACLVVLSRYRWKLILVACMLAPLVWMSLPEDRQLRFQTLFDPSVGPANAQESAESRSRYFWIAVDLWKESPALGHGPGSFLPLSHTGQVAHTLYGEVLSEVGLLGAIALVALLTCVILNARDTARGSWGAPWHARSFEFWLSVAICVAMLSLLLMGLGGDNLYRFTWLWYGAFSAIAARCALDELYWSDETEASREHLEVNHLDLREIRIVT